MKKRIVASLLVMALVITTAFSFTAPTTVSAATKKKEIAVVKIKGNKLTYRKCGSNTEIKKSKKWKWENKVGYGKKKSIKISKNCKYYLLGKYNVKLKKVTKAKFKKEMKNYEGVANKECGLTWYWNMAAKLYIKNGKVVKIEQVFQS